MVTRLELQMPPDVVAVLVPLVEATNGPDDPTRYLLDQMIATFPDGAIKTVARDAAPLLAAYVNEQLADLAPHFASGIRGLAGGLARIATQFETVEAIQIEAAGRTQRTITGARFAIGPNPIELSFAGHGLNDSRADTTATLDRTGRLTLADHSIALPYGALVRLGFDEAVIPSIVPSARDLDTALRALLDCAKLGDLVSARVGLGSPGLYRAACDVAMTTLASNLYQRLDRIAASSLTLELTGTAIGTDRDGDGSMDTIDAGSWSGTSTSGTSHAPIAASTFSAIKSR